MQDRSETETRDDRIPVDRADVDTATDDSRDRTVSPASAPTPKAPSVSPQSNVQQDAELLPADVLDDFRTRWEKIQIQFVDEPRPAVQSAHDLVDQLVDRLAESFTRQRETLEGTWSRGESDTEALRMALQQYRSFFNRLLSA